MVGVVSLSDVSDPLLDMVKREIQHEIDEVILAFHCLELLCYYCDTFSRKIRKKLLLSQSCSMLASYCLFLF